MHNSDAQRAEAISRKRYLFETPTGGWQYRRRWPQRVRALADGEFFIRGLGTADLSEAIRHRPFQDIEFNNAVGMMERRLDAQPRKLSESEAISIVSAMYRDRYAGMETDHRSRLLSEQARHELSEDYDQSAGQGGPWDAGGPTDAKEVADKLLSDRGIDAPRSGPGYAALVNLVETAQRELEEQGNALHYMREYTGPADAILKAALEASNSGRPRRTLGDLIEAHRADKESGWGQSAIAAYKPVHRLLREALGTTRTLDSIGREEGRELKRLVMALPANLGKLKALKGLSVPEAVEKAKALGLPTITPKTINGTYLGCIKAIFKWGVEEGWVDSSPVAGLSVPDPVSDADRRDPFTLVQLQKLFGSAPWNPVDRAPYGKPARYWVPMLALLHGLRLGEASGLLVADVEEREGITVMLVQPSGERRLKNEYSRRIVPVHSEAIRLGFLDFVQEQREAGEKRVFPDALGKARGQVGYNVSRWFSEYLKALDITGKGIGIHAFRHNFEDRLREADLHGTPIGQYLAGRSSGGGVSANYGSTYSTGRLRDAIELVKYPGLYLSHIVSRED